MHYSKNLHSLFLALALVVMPAAGAMAQGYIDPSNPDLGPDGCGGCEGEGGAPPPESVSPPTPEPEPAPEPAPTPATRPAPQTPNARLDDGDGGPCEFRSDPDSCARPRTCSIVVERQKIRINNRTVFRIVRGKKWVCRR